MFYNLVNFAERDECSTSKGAFLCQQKNLRQQMMLNMKKETIFPKRCTESGLDVVVLKTH